MFLDTAVIRRKRTSRRVSVPGGTAMAARIGAGQPGPDKQTHC